MRNRWHIALAALMAASALVASPAQAIPGNYVAARGVVPGTPVPTGGEGVALACSGPGTVRLVFANRTTVDIYALQGTAFIDQMEIVDVAAAATTAPCTVSVLYRTPSADPR